MFYQSSLSSLLTRITLSPLQVLVTLCVLGLTRGQEFVPAPSGVVVTSRDPVHSIRAYAQVMVKVEGIFTDLGHFPTTLGELQRQVNTLLRNNTYRQTRGALQLRIRRLKDGFDSLARPMRTKRSLLDGPITELVGGAAHFLGLATVKDMALLAKATDTLATAVDGVVETQQQTVAVVNQLGHAQNELASQLTATTVVLTQLETRINEIENEIGRLFLVLDINTFLDSIETALQVYNTRRTAIAASRADCEAQAVSEQLIPKRIISKLLSTPGNQVKMTPETYYQYLMVEKVITTPEGDLYCVIQAPLLSGEAQELYRISSFPVCSEGSCYRIYQDVDVVVATLSATLYYPRHCYGSFPLVCQPGVLYSKEQQPCIHGLVAGDTNQQQMCPIIYTDRPEPPRPHPTRLRNRYVVRTDNILYHYRCEGARPVTGKLTAGVHVVTIDPNCDLDAGTWLLHGIPTLREAYNISIPLPEVVVIPHLQQMNFSRDIHIPPGIRQMEYDTYHDLQAPPDSHIYDQVHAITKEIGQNHWFWLWILIGIAGGLFLLFITWRVIAFKKAGRPLNQLLQFKSMSNSTKQLVDDPKTPQPAVAYDPNLSKVSLYPPLPYPTAPLGLNNLGFDTHRFHSGTQTESTDTSP